MATFALICTDKPGSLDLRMATREAHLAYVGGHVQQIRYGGPFLDENGGMNGSLILIELADLAAAKAFSAGDPYVVAGLFQSVDIRAVRPTLSPRL